MNTTVQSKPLSMEELSVPYDYDKIFGKSTLFITGTGRSGTTLLGKILGSLENVYYLHEPNILHFLPVLHRNNASLQKQYAEMLKLILFEDYLLNLIHGRNVNFNELDLSYVGNYQKIDVVKERWSKFRRRQDVVDHLINFIRR